MTLTSNDRPTTFRFQDDYTPFHARNATNEFGELAGGYVRGVGIELVFQDGPLKEDEYPSGCFVEHLLEAVQQRIAWYQENGTPCDENAEAVAAIQVAINALIRRHQRIDDPVPEPAPNCAAVVAVSDVYDTPPEVEEAVDGPELPRMSDEDYQAAMKEHFPAQSCHHMYVAEYTACPSCGYWGYAHELGNECDAGCGGVFITSEEMQAILLAPTKEE